MASFDLLSALAEIAGIFIGFGALIILSEQRRGGALQIMLRQVVVSGLVTLVGALIPIAIGQFGVDGAVLWRASAATFLGVIWFAILHPRSRRLIADQVRNDPRAAAFFWLVLEPPIQVPLLLVLFGLYPQHAPGLYAVAVVINLLQGAQLLAQAVYARSGATGE